MQIIQEQRTIIKAEDGKVLRKKTTGKVVGDTVHLGYDYYEAGILLKEPHLAKPDDYEEVDIITDEEGNQVIPSDNNFRRLKQINSIILQELAQLNDLTIEECLLVKRLFPIFGLDIKEGDHVSTGFRFLFKGDLYEVQQDHQILKYYTPDLGNLYKLLKV